MEYKVNLIIFEDDSTGEWGLAHKNSINNQYGSNFNAFWNGIGIFHDVFEHYFEDVNKYFIGDYAFNIGGEIAAMGHLAYYWNEFRPSERRLNPNSIYSFEEAIIASTESEIEDAITYGNWNFGNKLLCNVPKAKKQDYHYYLENIIQEHWYKIKNLKPKKDTYSDDEQFQSQKDYKKSITLSKLRDLYTWGWKQGEKIFPSSEENRETITDFINFWNKFCKENRAEDLNYFKEVEFTINCGEKTTWDCHFIANKFEKIPYKDVYYQEFELQY